MEILPRLVAFLFLLIRKGVSKEWRWRLPWAMG